MSNWVTRIFSRGTTSLILMLLGLFQLDCGGGSLSGTSASAPSPASAQYTWKSVAISGGGFIPGIVFSPKEANLIFARTDIGGCYKWNDSTSSWAPLMDWLSPGDWNLMGCESIAADPVDSNRVYLVVGTYTNEWTSQNGAVLRSTDKGSTWTRIDLPFKVGGNMPGRSMGERLAIDPNLNSVLFMGTRSGNGLWKSADSGSTWAKVTSFPNAGTYYQDSSSTYTSDLVGVVWVTFDPSTGSTGSATKTIYVGVADKANSIYRSTDGGATWAAVPGQPTGFLPHHGVLASTGILYVTYSNGAGPYDGTSGDVWKLDTATGTWTLISPVPSTDTSNDYFGYGGLAVDVQHPNTVMVSALNSWWPDTIIFRSTDAGATWTRIWDWASYPSRTLRYTLDITAAPWLTFGNLPADPVPSPKLGWMVGDLEIDPFNSNRMMYGTGATLYGTNNLTAWDTGGTINITVMSGGIEETAILDLMSPPSGPPLVSGVGDVNGFVHTRLDTVPASMLLTPSITNTSLDYAELTPTFMVRVGNVSKTDYPNVNRAGFSYDGGTNWFQASTEPSGVSDGGTVAAAADASRVVWAPAGAQVSYSTDNGSSWIASTGISQGATVASDRLNPKKFYGFVSGSFYVSTNGGASFTAAGSGLSGLSSAKIKAVPGIEGDVWVAGGDSGLSHSTDSGATFTKVASVTSANAIGLGKAASGKTYMSIFIAGTIGGVNAIFRSDDVGASWTRVTDDQHQFGVSSPVIAGDPRVYGRVYVGTNGRGILYGDVSGTTTTNDFSLSVSPSTLTVNQGASGTSTVTVSPTGSFASAVTLTASGLPSGVTASFSPASTTGTSTLTLTASSTATTGTTAVTLTGTGGGLTHTATLNLTVSSSSSSTTPCANAIAWTGQTGNFNTTGAVCYKTNATISGWGCSSFAGRTISVNNTTVTCGAMPLPAKWSDGYYYFSVSAGTLAYASMYYW